MFEDLDYRRRHFLERDQQFFDSTQEIPAYFEISELKNLICRFLNLENKKYFLHLDLNITKKLDEFIDCKSVLASDGDSAFIQLNSGKSILSSPFDDYQKNLIKEIQNHFYDFCLTSIVSPIHGMGLNDLKTLDELCYEKNIILIIDITYSFLYQQISLNELKSKHIILFNFSNQKGFVISTFPISSSEFSDQSSWQGPYSILQKLESEHYSTLTTFLKIQKKQQRFREKLLEIDHHYLLEKNILTLNYSKHGPIYAFALPSPEHALKTQQELKNQGILTDLHENKLIFKFDI